MADFCRQCSITALGLTNAEYDSAGDLMGLQTEADTAAGMSTVVICEGCELTEVDHLGNCQGGCAKAEEHGK